MILVHFGQVNHSSLAAQEPDINSGRTLIDAVNWDVISQLHGTRGPKACRQKWYDNLAPSMVSRGQSSTCSAAVHMYYGLYSTLAAIESFCMASCVLHSWGVC